MADLQMQKDADFSKLVTQELGDPYKRLVIVFLLIGVIPALALAYVLGNKLWTGDRSISDMVPVLFFSNLIMVLGYLIGYGLIKNILRKILAYADKAKHADELKSSFAMDLAHDLKSPLSVIMAHISNLKAGFMGALSKEQEEALTVCRDVTDRMSTLLMDLVNTYKIEARLTELKISVFDLCRVLEEQYREFEAVASEKKIALTLDPVPSSLPFKGDRSMVLRAINNILNNAIKYTPQGGKVTVKARVMEGLARIEVTNTGAKIPGEKLEKIFDKFERLDGKIEGEGLGLAIAKDIVELHKGRIWASSGPGEFNCFTILLPLAREPAP